MIVMVFFIMSSVGLNRAGVDYSYYMKSRRLDINSDPNNLLYENASDANQFRNRMVSNERVAGDNIFAINQPPSKTGYAVNQYYFDNLDDDRVWESYNDGQDRTGNTEALYGTDNYKVNNGTIADSANVASEGKRRYGTEQTKSTKYAILSEGIEYIENHTVYGDCIVFVNDYADKVEVRVFDTDYNLLDAKSQADPGPSDDVLDGIVVCGNENEIYTYYETAGGYWGLFQFTNGLDTVGMKVDRTTSYRNADGMAWTDNGGGALMFLDPETDTQWSITWEDPISSYDSWVGDNFGKVSGLTVKGNKGYAIRDSTTLWGFAFDGYKLYPGTTDDPSTVINLDVSLSHTDFLASDDVFNEYGTKWFMKNGNSDKLEEVYTEQVIEWESSAPNENEYSKYDVPHYDNISADVGKKISSGDLNATDGNTASLDSTSGGFYATYDFNNDSEGDIPTDWTVDNDPDQVEVLNEKYGREKVVLFNKTSSTNPVLRTNKSISKIEDNGFLEFYYCQEGNPTGESKLRFSNFNHDQRIQMSFYDDVIRVDNPWGFYHIVDIVPETWYHIRLEFDFSTDDDCKIWINGDLKETGMWFINNSDSTNVRMHSFSNYVQTDLLDDFGFSSDPTYNKGDNTKETANATLESEVNYQLQNVDTDSISDCKLDYAFKTNTSQVVDFDIWNYDTGHWDPVEYGVFTSISSDNLDLNEHYINEINNIKLKFYGQNTTYPFRLEIDQLRVRETDLAKYYEYAQYVNFDFELENLRSELIAKFLSDFHIVINYIDRNITFDSPDSDWFHLDYYDSYLGEWRDTQQSDFADTNPDTFGGNMSKAAPENGILSMRLECEYYQAFKLEINEYLVRYNYTENDNVGYHTIQATYTNGASEEMDIDIFRDYMFINFEEMMGREYTFNLSNANSLEIQTHFRINDGGEAVMRLKIIYNQEASNSETLYFRNDAFGQYIVYERFNYTYNNPLYEIYSGKNQTTYYPAITGFRDLYTEETSFNRFVDIPLYSEAIDVEAEEPDRTDQDEVDDPEPPKGRKYWNMPTWEIKTIETVTIEHGNFSFDYDKIGPVAKTSKFGYDDETFDEFKIKEDWGIWNFLRDGLEIIVNFFVLLANQFVLWVVYGSLYVMNLALNWFFVGLIVGIIVAFIWNVPIFWVVDASIMLGWFVWEALVGLFNWLAKAFYAVFEWFMENVFKDLFKFLMGLAIWIFALVIWGFTLFQGDLDTIHSNVEEMFNLITETFLDDIMVFMNNLPAFLSYVPSILVIAGFCWLKYFYTQARGFKNRSERCYMYFQVLLAPFVWAYAIIKKIKDLLFGWM